MPTRRRVLLALLLLAAMALASLVLALATGSMPVGLADLAAAMAGDASTGSEVIRQLRLPRALAAFGVGALLALSGALMQALLKNPLADPYVLGISGGAGVAALAAMFVGLGAGAVGVAAFLGALGSLLLVLAIGRGEGAWTGTRLMLAGIAVAAGCGAAIAFLLTVAPEGKLRTMLFWLMGDLAQASDPWPALITVVVVLTAGLFMARDLNLLARGADFARSLGVEAARVRWLALGAASLAAAVGVTTAGSIGFVGLVVPHLIRLAAGGDHRLLLPASALAGGTLLVLADTAARTLLAPQQLPVGVLTAFIGVPAFLWLVAREPR